PPASTVFHTLSLHDALPICRPISRLGSFSKGFDLLLYGVRNQFFAVAVFQDDTPEIVLSGLMSDLLEGDVNTAVEHGAYNGNEKDRKSTRLNSSHGSISYAV